MIAEGFTPIRRETLGADEDAPELPLIVGIG
jgi:hypothetical protein